MNLANKLTLSRFLMVPFFVGFLSLDEQVVGMGWELAGRIAALVLFISASLTDYYDGVLARRHGWETNFGRLMDPLADKLIVLSALVAFVGLDVFPAWMAIFIICRELLITGLRLLGTSQQRVIQADRWGKNKTISQMVVIIMTLVFLALEDGLQLAGAWGRAYFLGLPLGFWMHVALLVAMYVALFFTAVSGILYFWCNRDLLRQEPLEGPGVR